MGSYSEEPEFKTLTIKKLHPTFAAEVEGVNFQDLTDEQFQEIFAAMAKVRIPSRQILPIGLERLVICRFISGLTLTNSMVCACSATRVSTMRDILHSRNGLAI
jgi:hypothetical protein